MNIYWNSCYYIAHTLFLFHQKASSIFIKAVFMPFPQIYIQGNHILSHEQRANNILEIKLIANSFFSHF